MGQWVCGRGGRRADARSCCPKNLASSKHTMNTAKHAHKPPLWKNHVALRKYAKHAGKIREIFQITTDLKIWLLRNQGAAAGRNNSKAYLAAADLCACRRKMVCVCVCVCVCVWVLVWVWVWVWVCVCVCVFVCVCVWVEEVLWGMGVFFQVRQHLFIVRTPHTTQHTHSHTHIFIHTHTHTYTHTHTPFCVGSFEL